MIELIEVLNNTSADRTIFYVISGLIALAVIVKGMVGITKAVSKPFSRKPLEK